MTTPWAAQRWTCVQNASRGSRAPRGGALGRWAKRPGKAGIARFATRSLTELHASELRLPAAARAAELGAHEGAGGALEVQALEHEAGAPPGQGARSSLRSLRHPAPRRSVHPSDPAHLPGFALSPPTAELALSLKIYIYIYIERERERDR